MVVAVMGLERQEGKAGKESRKNRPLGKEGKT